MRTKITQKPGWVLTKMSLAILGLMTAPVVYAGVTTNTVPVAAGQLVASSRAELVVPIDHPVGSTVFGYPMDTQISSDGKVASGVMSLDAGKYLVFSSSAEGKKSMQLLGNISGYGGVSDDGKASLYYVRNFNQTGLDKLVLVRDVGGSNLQATELSVANTVNGVGGFQLFGSQVLSKSGTAVAYGLYNSNSDLAQAAVMLGSTANPLDESSVSTYLLGSNGRYSDGLTGDKTAVYAIAHTPDIARAVGTVQDKDGFTRAAYWDVSPRVVTVNAKEIDLSAQHAVMGHLATTSRTARAEQISANGNVIAGMIGGQKNPTEWVYGTFAWRKDNTTNGTSYLLRPDADVSHSSHDGSAVVAVSDNGNVIAVNGYSMHAYAINPTEGFVWKYNSSQDRYEATNIGQLDGNQVLAKQRTKINALSADGTVAVGVGTRSINGVDGQFTAFRWSDSNGMQSVSDWLSSTGLRVSSDISLMTATDVSQDGNVVVGVAENMGPGSVGSNFYYLARAGGSGFNSGLMNIAQFNQTLNSASLNVTSLHGNLLNMSMNGAHHRSLMDNGLAKGDVCSWTTADAGAGRGNSSQLFEAGVCHDIGNWRVGIGAGKAVGKTDLEFSGSAKLDGVYMLAEADYGWDDWKKVFGVTVLSGDWKLKQKRGYTNAASVNYSDSTSDIGTLAVRARFDWRDALSVGNFSFSPYLSFTHIHSNFNGYTEHGGAFPVSFNDRSVKTEEARLGLSAAKYLDEKNTLRLSAEVVDQLRHSEDNVRGKILGLNSFDFASGSKAQSWGRFGVEVDHYFNRGSMISAGLNASSAGGDAAFSGSLSLKVAF